MKKIIILIFSFLQLQAAGQFKAEKIKLGIQSGVVYAQHEDLKSVNQQVIGQLPFKVNLVDDFEPAYYYGVYLQYELFKRFCIGPVYEYIFTGSQLGVRDYSGKFSFNQYLHAHESGLKLDYSAYVYKKLRINTQLNSGVCLTDWKMISTIELGDNAEYSDTQEENFKGSSWYTSTDLTISYRIIPQICLMGSVGYSFDKDKSYYYVEDKNLDLDKIPDWSGLNISLVLEFTWK